MLRVAVVALSAAALSVLPTSPAHALVAWQVVTTAGRFVPADLVITQGDTLVLTNLDPTGLHDVTALDNDANGPLFASATIGTGQTSTVAGVSTLERSTYPFFCTVHEYMTGTLTVV